MQWWIDLLGPVVMGLAVAAAVGVHFRALFRATPERDDWRRMAPGGSTGSTSSAVRDLPARCKAASRRNA